MAKARGFSEAKRDISGLADALEDDMNTVGRGGASDIKSAARKQLNSTNQFGSTTTLSGSLERSIGEDESHNYQSHEHSHLVIADAPHGPYVEFGTGDYNLAQRADRNFSSPSFSPRLRKNIKAWIIIRGITPRSPDMSIDELSWVIAQSIAEHGTRRQAFMKPAYYENRRKIMRKAKSAVRSRTR